MFAVVRGRQKANMNVDVVRIIIEQAPKDLAKLMTGLANEMALSR